MNEWTLVRATADGSGSNISLLLRTRTDSESLVKICGLTRAQKFQDPHISDDYANWLCSILSVFSLNCVTVPVLSGVIIQRQRKRIGIYDKLR